MVLRRPVSVGTGGELSSEGFEEPAGVVEIVADLRGRRRMVARAGEEHAVAGEALDRIGGRADR